MTNQTFDFEAITDDEAGEALAEVLDEELEVAAGGGWSAANLDLWRVDPRDQVYG